MAAPANIPYHDVMTQQLTAIINPNNFGIPTGPAGLRLKKFVVQLKNLDLQNHTPQHQELINDILLIVTYHRGRYHTIGSRTENLLVTFVAEADCDRCVLYFHGRKFGQCDVEAYKAEVAFDEETNGSENEVQNEKTQEL